MDSRAFFLLVENIIEIRRNLLFKKKFPLGEDYFCKWTTDFLASGNHFFSIFQRFLPVITRFFFVWRKSVFQQNPSCRLVETDFLTSGNRYLLFRDFSSWWKPPLKLFEANCKRKGIF